MERIENSDLELEALALFSGRPSVLEVFLELTDNNYLNLRWDPLEESINWEAAGKPTDKEIEQIAAVRFLMDKGYIIDSVTDNGIADFTINASEKADELRVVYNRLPATLKEKIFEKQKNL